MATRASSIRHGWHHVFSERSTRGCGFAVVSNLDRVRRPQSVGLCNDASLSGVNGVEAVW
jgi:hypothetical protein